jgi:hypothetical protein
MEVTPLAGLETESDACATCRPGLRVKRTTQTARPFLHDAHAVVVCIGHAGADADTVIVYGN